MEDVYLFTTVVILTAYSVNTEIRLFKKIML